MLIHSCIMISAAVFDVPTGILSDLAGRKKTIMMGSIVSCVGVVFFALADSFWFLLAGAVLQGMSRSFFSGNNEALIHDSLSDEGKEGNYPGALGRARSMYQLALALSAIVGAMVAPWSLRWTVWATIPPQLLTILLSFFFVEPTAHSQESTNVFTHMKESIVLFLSNAKIRILSIGSIVWNGLGETIFYFEPVFIGMLWPVWGIGIARTFDHALGWMSYWYAGAIIRKVGTLRTLIAALVCSILLGLAAFGYPFILSPLILVLTAIPYGLIIVSQDTLLQKEFSQKQRATMGSLNNLFGSLFFAFCAVVLGWIGDQWTPTIAMFIAQICLIAILPLYWFFHRTHDREHAVPTLA